MTETSIKADDSSYVICYFLYHWQAFNGFLRAMIRIVYEYNANGGEIKD